MQLTRRDFIQSAAAAGMWLTASKSGIAEQPAETPAVPSPKNPDEVNVALIGVGAQGRVLLDAARRIPGIKFKAVCDIWPYSQQYGAGQLARLGHKVNVYEDYREMLDKEKGLNAVLVATPDWMHAEHANACLQAGLHVYCEKEMSNSLEKARSMVQTAKSTGKLLQIGHQRRSNPRYRHAIDVLIREANLLGRVTHAYGQWNRAKSDDLTCAERLVISQEKLEKYGYTNMHAFQNWRWFKKYGGGPIVDLGSHQIDLFAWVWGCNPKSVIASGGIDFYKTHEWYDNVLTIYEFETPLGVSRAFYQVLTTNKNGGYYEKFMGEDGTILISEQTALGNAVESERDEQATEWKKWVEKGYLDAMTDQISRSATQNTVVDVRASKPPKRWPLPIELSKPAHQPHLENFFGAIRYGVKLNCPAEVGYETAVAVLAANESVAAGRRVEFKAEEFRV